MHRACCFQTNSKTTAVQASFVYLYMRPARTIYRQLDSKLITPEMYGNAPGKDSLSLNKWRDSFLSALSDLGVSMQEFKVTDKDSFLKSPDVIGSIGDVFPANTYGYGYQYSNYPTPDDEVFLKEYEDSNKFFTFHFVCDGVPFYAVLLVKARLASLAISANGGDPANYTLSSKFHPGSSDSLAVLLHVLVDSYLAKGEFPKAPSVSATEELVTAYRQSQKGGSKKKVKSSLRPSISALTQHDIASLLSSSNPTHIFWSPLLNKAAVKDSHGWYVASFHHLNSGWTLDWFTLSATPVKSNGHKYIMYSGSRLIPID